MRQMLSRIKHALLGRIAPPRSRALLPWRAGAPPRTLFISAVGGAPMRYRVLHQAEQLEIAGVAHAALEGAGPIPERELDGCDLLYLYRVDDTPQIRAAVAAVRA